MPPQSANHKPVKPRPPFLKALGCDDPPKWIRLNTVAYQRVEIYKHDSFAATARYERAEPTDADDVIDAVNIPKEIETFPQAVVLKTNRQQSLFGFPMRWVGRFLEKREKTVYLRMKEVEGVPAYLGAISDTSLIHAHVPGDTLWPKADVPLSFLHALDELVRAFHQREVAVVDIQKCENVIMGDDGKPYLVDFQISFSLAASGLGRSAPMRMLYRILVRSDHYHITKHFYRFHPEALSPERRAEIERRPFWVRVHRFFTRPLQQLRRKLLIWLGVRDKKGKASSELSVEKGLRNTQISEKMGK